MDLETISVLMFFGIIGILIYLDKKNIEFKYGLVIRRTKKGIKLISDFASRHKKSLTYMGNFAIVLGIITSILGLGFLAYNTFLGIRTAGIVLPTVGEYQYPGPVYSVPFWYWIIAIFIVVTAHEPMHALFARLEKVKINDMGLFLFLFFPLGAFANPDEIQIKKLSLIKKLRIFAAGSFGNIIVVGIFILLILGYNFVIDSLMTTRGVVFEEIIENTGAQETGLNGVIREINDVEIKSILDLGKVMKDVKPGDIISIKTTEGEFQVKTIPHPDDSERSFIGIGNLRNLFVYKGLLGSYGEVSERMINVLSWFLGLLDWVFLLNLGVGIFNLFPMKPLDGGLMFEGIIKNFYKGKKVEYIVNGVSLLVFALILIHLFGPDLVAWIG